jgi:hypothetical protein
MVAALDNGDVNLPTFGIVIDVSGSPGKLHVAVSVDSPITPQYQEKLI